MTGGIAPRSASSSRGAHLDGVDDGDGGDRRARTDRRVEAIDGDEGVGGRGAQVDDEVGLVHATGCRRSDRASADIDCATEVTATTRSPAPARAARHLDGHGRRPPAENTISMSCGPNVKFDRMTSASPGMRSMNIAWRWPLAPTTWVWNVIDSSTIGLNPGYEP